MDKSFEIPILIIGYPRSGTTMLRRLVSMHPMLQFELVHENPRPLLKSTTKEDAIKKLTYSAIQEGKETGSIMSIKSGQKIPYHSIKEALKYINKFKLLFPEGHIIHIVRNPIDTISSELRTFSTKVDKCIKKYFAAVPQVSAFIKNYDFALEVHYEDIISKPAESVSSIYTWMGFKVDNSYILKVISTKDPWVHEGRIMPGLRYFEKIENRISKNIVLNSKNIKKIKDLDKKINMY